MQMEMEKPEEIHLCFSPADLPSLEVLYTTAIYWSYTTLTTVGYGDITPCNEYEMLWCVRDADWKRHVSVFCWPKRRNTLIIAIPPSPPSILLALCLHTSDAPSTH